MIKNMDHTYIQHGIKFYAFIEPVFSRREVDGEICVIDAHNFYIFDEKGFCWLQMTHVEIKYVMNELGNGFFKARVAYTIDAPVDAIRKPIVRSDEWIQGSADKGYALETIREALGLDIQYLTALMGEKTVPITDNS